MIKYIKYIILGLSFSVCASAEPVPNIFNSGDLVSSSKINENFQALADRIDTLSAVSTWSVSGVFVYGGSDIYEIPSDATYVLKEIIHTRPDSVCTFQAGNNVMVIPRTYLVSLTQGITLESGDIISMECAGGSSNQGNITISGTKYNIP